MEIGDVTSIANASEYLSECMGNGHKSFSEGRESNLAHVSILSRLSVQVQHWRIEQGWQSKVKHMQHKVLKKKTEKKKEGRNMESSYKYLE